MIKKVKNNVINGLTEKNCWNVLRKRIAEKKIENSLELRNKKIRKGDELYVKFKRYDNLFNCWIDEKDLV